MSSQPDARALAAERSIGRMMIGLTFLSVGLLVIGGVLMVADGIDPRSGGPAVDLAAIGSQLASLRPEGFLWLGLLAVITAPIGRVVVAGLTYARAGDRLMAGVAVAILLVIVVGIGSALTVTV